MRNLTHRGAVGADKLQGDGAGILIQVPDTFLRRECGKLKITLPAIGQYGVGMVFLPQEPASRMACEQEIERAIASEGQVLLGWRDVPVNPEGLGDGVKAIAPIIRQVFVGRGSKEMSQQDLERKLYIIRKSSGHAIQALKLRHGKEFYVPSMSTRTIVYKGMLLADQVGTFYLDLQDPMLVSALAMVHQRFSTNTFPTWDLAHPFRMVCHNGEINTLRGNCNWIRAREGAIASTALGDDLPKLWPLIYDGQSDTASFDNCLELLVMSGYSLGHATMMMIPEAWAGNPLMDEDRRAFYEYHAALMEPWDGPAAIAFTDGRQIGATLDRNGLRPARYVVTDDDMIVMASEVGVLEIPEEKIVKKWRLQPGKMLLIDLEKGTIVDDETLKQELASEKPYREWIERSRVSLEDLPEPAPADKSAVSLLDRQQAFGYSQEDLKVILAPMVANAEEATGSMGNDAALPVLSNKAKPIFNYFRQLFAQVTNPPIDPIREELVMSLVTFIGPRPNLLGVDAKEPQSRLEAQNPILTSQNMERIRHVELFSSGAFKSKELDITYPASWGVEGVEAAVASLCAAAVDNIKLGYNILILSDRAVAADRVPIPCVAGNVCRASASGENRYAHFGGSRRRNGLRARSASLRAARRLRRGGDSSVSRARNAHATRRRCAANLEVRKRKALRQSDLQRLEQSDVEDGHLDLSKLLRRADFRVRRFESSLPRQIFHRHRKRHRRHRHFRSRRRANAHAPRRVRQRSCARKFARRRRRIRDAYARRRAHVDAATISKLQHATRANNATSYKEYAALINDQTGKLKTLRGLFAFKFDQRTPISIDEVEPAKEIVKRFATGAMSLGSISTEAHATLAVAMNRIGGKSNTGEGGEDAMRYIPLKKGETMQSRLGEHRVVKNVPVVEGDSMRSKIKQVASGRFGVTAEYLASADQIQIKMAQGAKPGEGGQLPGHKVSEYIAQLRFSVPGVGLISPPPHHDIYSIEDLAQLIHDLKNANPKASISVKLVSEVGIGTVAAGVAKCKADHIVVAGHDGGTGASPISSIKHAGTPWELGLAETQQTLVLNRLRGRVRVQADGQMKTGRDVAIAALLGADEFGFATAPLVVEGCIMMRKCHLNTCPVGVATQDPELRKKFTGQPEHVVNYFFFVAEEVREIMAKLGVRTFDELVGHSEWLDTQSGIAHWKARGLDFSKVFYTPKMPAEVSRSHNESQDHGLEGALDHTLIANAKATLENKTKVEFEVTIGNHNRSVGAMLSNAIAVKYGHAGLPADTITARFKGIAGQSFGAFLARGVTFEIEGATNDYCGKGLSGGRIVVYPDAKCPAKPEENIVIGNTVMYGATEGEAFFRGIAGERFGVRNSGATAVVEGTGDHGCEYMTGGTVVVLGATGRNFAAGMSGGVAYVYDPKGAFAKHCNLSMVSLEPLLSEVEQTGVEQEAIAQGKGRKRHLGQSDEAIVKSLVERHLRYTGSTVALSIMDDWAAHRKHFVKVFPIEYKRALTDMYAESMKSTKVTKEVVAK